MQRSPALRQLSIEHYRGLVLARRAREQARTDPVQQAPVWAELRAAFVRELEPHFQTEERGLLPALERVGEPELVTRTLEEHRQLRALITQGDASDLAAFAQALSDHIRFEEQILFETAQRVLDEATLTALAKQSAREARPRCDAG